jgi:2-C-methyl-D-erythritol 4-phosphate cytidylyltransferase
MKVAVIIPAAGAGERYKAQSPVGRSKLDEPLGDRPVLQRTVELFTKRDDVSAIIVAAPLDPDARADFDEKHADKLAILGAVVVPGGKTHRYETVAAALEHLPADATHVAVHDAARPATPMELIDRLFAAAAKHPAVIPGLPVSDTLKRVAESEAAADEPDPLDVVLGIAKGPRQERTVEQTVDRAGLYAVQTPQVFELDLLRRAYAQRDLTSTDDAQLVERLGEPVHVIDADARNIKITVPADLELARRIMGLRESGGRPTHKRF